MIQLLFEVASRERSFLYMKRLVSSENSVILYEGMYVRHNLVSSHTGCSLSLLYVDTFQNCLQAIYYLSRVCKFSQETPLNKHSVSNYREI